jgi:hypothetical protein
LQKRTAGTDSDIEEDLPLRFYLGQNYPNPFKERTTVKYCVAYRTRVVLTVCDAQGRVIERLVDEVRKAGTYEAEFRVAKERLESGKASEMYYYRLEAGDFSADKQMEVII